jgi:hypothetical protein
MRDYVDARDDAVEARLNQKLERLATKSTIWAAMATALGVVFAAWALAGDRFDTGLSVSPMLEQVQANQNAVNSRQDAQTEMLNRKLDILIERSATTENSSGKD